MPRRPAKPKPLPLALEPKLDPEILALRQMELAAQEHSLKVDKIYKIGTALGIHPNGLREASRDTTRFLPMFEIAAREEGLDL